jgi:hypothetical protein
MSGCNKEWKSTVHIPTGDTTQTEIRKDSQEELGPHMIWESVDLRDPNKYMVWYGKTLFNDAGPDSNWLISTGGASNINYLQKRNIYIVMLLVWPQI